MKANLFKYAVNCVIFGLTNVISIVTALYNIDTVCNGIEQLKINLSKRLKDLIQIETFKINWNAESKLNTRENINYKNGESVSPTRSATMRRQRSRSSHGTERSMTTSSDSSKDAGGHGGRQTASAAPINRRPPVSTDTNNKSNETN